MVYEENRFIVPDEVLKEYFNVANIVNVRAYGNGHINSTFLVEFSSCQYILQKINNTVFDNPIVVMNNIDLVTNYIRKKVIYDGKDPRTSVLTTIFTRYGQTLAIVNEEFWRCMRFIDEGITYDEAPSPEIFGEAGRVIGEFQHQLDGFHTRLLIDPIKHFHDTPYRYNHFQDILKIDRLDRKVICLKEIKYINSNKNKLSIITDLLEEKKIPRRVTHNDTKLNNIMISKNTGKALCLIDLDTVMKGSLLYDYGDALRVGASTAAEDEVDLKKVKINFEMFEAFTRGYLSEVKDIIVDDEVRHLIDGFYLMAMELGMRFLTDFIDGDRYFAIKPEVKKVRPYINLERAKCQLHLAKEIENNYDKLKDIINQILKDLDYSIQL